MKVSWPGTGTFWAAVIFLITFTMCVGVASADTAESTFKMKCAACHGADGKGATAAGKAMGANDFASDTVQKMSDAELIQAVSMGKGKMPAYGKTLKESDIKDLVGYVRELGKKK